MEKLVVVTQETSCYDDDDGHFLLFKDFKNAWEKANFEEMFILEEQI